METQRLLADFSDFSLAIYAALGFIVLRFFLDATVFQVLTIFVMAAGPTRSFVFIFMIRVIIYKNMKLAYWHLYKGATVPAKLKESKNTRISKCTECMWKLSYYAAVQLFIYFAAYNEPWFGDAKELFKGWPYQTLGFPLKLFYMTQCGFYMYSIAALLLWEIRRKDYTIMMSHHVITVLLIGYSYAVRFFRCGAIVLALHDTSDVFMEAAKLSKYGGRELPASVFFGLFAVSWLLLRLIYFPFWIIRSTSYDLIHALSLPNPFHIWLYYIFNTMLLTLFMFHIYWWILICNMVLRQLKNRGKVGDDIRSDSEDGD